MASAVMTAPRQVLPGTCYLFTRRCLQRQFLLRPSAEVTQLLGFLLAVAAERFAVEVHAFCVMSNHLHLILTDTEGRLPDFARFLDSLVARAMNARLGCDDYFWGSPTYSAVALQQPADVVAKIAYVLANPVEAGLVRHGRKWPGLWSAPGQMGATTLVFKRPARFFREKGETALPEEARLTLAIPRGFDPVEFRREVGAALEARERTLAAELAEAGREFIGVERVLAQSPFGRPATAEPSGGLNPRVACRDQFRRMEALGRLVAFLDDHHRAFERWREGARDVVFPAGTYLMRVVHGAACAVPG
jgi:REP element-mobilizing transposase RayT